MFRDFQSLRCKVFFHYSQTLRCKVCFIILKQYAAKCVSLYSDISLQSVFHYTQVSGKVYFIILKHYASRCVTLYSGITLQNVFHQTQLVQVRLLIKRTKTNKTARMRRLICRRTCQKIHFSNSRRLFSVLFLFIYFSCSSSRTGSHRQRANTKGNT